MILYGSLTRLDGIMIIITDHSGDNNDESEISTLQFFRAFKLIISGLFSL